MREIGIDLSDRVPHKLETADVEWTDIGVLMGCGDACPILPGKYDMDWDLSDPKGRLLDQVRQIRDEIARRADVLVRELDAQKSVDTTQEVAR